MPLSTAAALPGLRRRRTRRGWRSCRSCAQALVRGPRPDARAHRRADGVDSLRPRAPTTSSGCGSACARRRAPTSPRARSEVWLPVHGDRAGAQRGRSVPLLATLPLDASAVHAALRGAPLRRRGDGGAPSGRVRRARRAAASVRGLYVSDAACAAQQHRRQSAGDDHGERAAHRARGSWPRGARA